MIAGKKLKLYPYDKVNAIDNKIENRRITGGSPYDGVLKGWQDLLNSGYILYDATTGFNGLTSATSGDYLTYFTSDLSTGYTVNSTYVNIHSSVIISGMVLDSNLQIKSHDTEFDLIFAGSSNAVDFSNTTVKWANFYQKFGGSPIYLAKNFNIENSRVWRLPNVAFQYYPGSVKNTRYEIDVDTPQYLLFSGGILENVSVINSISTNIYGFNITPTKFKNIFFDLDGVSLTITNAKYENVFIKNAIVGISGSTSEGTIYTKNVTFTGSTNSVQILNKPGSTDKQQFVFGVPSINWDLVDFTSFEDVDADYKVEYVIDNTKFFNTGTRTNYSMTFMPNNPIPDDIKKFSQDQYFFVQREDIETDIASSSGVKSIYNYSFYDTTAVSSEYDYSNDENFLIKAYRASDTSQVATFEFFNNQLYPTVFSDVWDDNVYIIENAFQIWEIESITDLKETIRDKTTKQGITNSPLQGTIRFNNLDNEVLEEL